LQEENHESNSVKLETARGEQKLIDLQYFAE